jgi:hypothetical protein
MTERLYRAQLLLERDQHRALAEIAEAENRSISEVVREIIREFLAERMAEYQLTRELSLLEELKQIRKGAEQRYGVIQEDIVTQAREERSAQADRILRGEDGG